MEYIKAPFLGCGVNQDFIFEKLSESRTNLFLLQRVGDPDNYAFNIFDGHSYQDMYESLKEIAEHKGRFSLDPLTHASNTIEDMTDLALKALGKAEGVSIPDDKK